VRIPLFAALSTTLLILAACGDTGEGGEVEVTLTEWEITTDVDSVPEGPIDFNIQNDGEETHELLIVKTDIAAGELPTRDDGSVDEDAPDLDVEQSIDDIEEGDDTSRTYELDAGSYVLICNIVDEVGGEEGEQSHYDLGMNTELTVTEE
jgi:hypothetical protein